MSSVMSRITAPPSDATSLPLTLVTDSAVSRRSSTANIISSLILTATSAATLGPVVETATATASISIPTLYTIETSLLLPSSFITSVASIASVASTSSSSSPSPTSDFVSVVTSAKSHRTTIIVAVVVTVVGVLILIALVIIFFRCQRRRQRRTLANEKLATDANEMPLQSDSLRPAPGVAPASSKRHFRGMTAAAKDKQKPVKEMEIIKEENLGRSDSSATATSLIKSASRNKTLPPPPPPVVLPRRTDAGRNRNAVVLTDDGDSLSDSPSFEIGVAQ
ncbi:hypothetical protein V1512DRAFT_256177 [Lipomyces arxii]|uniref:uncharacterized protein n=1 Tax=Lipomyces arxii TaxID=56418 RepID=UPI0034CD5A5B